MLLKLKRTPGIFLVGFMGSGKSTVGHALADELGWHFTDLDAEIERAEGTVIADIFDSRGEEEFRRIETDALARCVKSIQSGRPQVVSLGGGALLSEHNFNLVSHNGVTIWLDCPFETLAKRVAAASHRPLARDPERLRKLFNDRREGYARAEYRIDSASDDAHAAVAQILALSLL
ncbi:MAG: shikimate kinase [Bryobacterales bacterium]|nr:shikimate kinase [Bryobacterales bacterium]